MKTASPWTKRETDTAGRRYRAGDSLASIAGKLGRTPVAVEGRLRRAGLLHRAAKPFSDPRKRKTDETSGDVRKLEWTTDKPVKTAAQALAASQVDPTLWNVENCKFTHWESPTRDGGSQSLCSVRLELRRKTGWTPAEMVAELRRELGAKPRAANKPRIHRKPVGLLGEMSIMDHHFGKLAWAPESGDNYDLKIARQRYAKCAGVMVDNFKECRVDRVLFVAGNDFYHVDRGDNTTTAGTRVEADGRWQKAFTGGVAECRNAIIAAAEVAPVDVVIVPGNHDEEKAFLLGVVLQAIFEGSPRVNVLLTPAMLSRYVWGTTLLGFQHGHNMPVRRFNQLPNEMSHHWPRDWAATTWREWHLGHLHHECEDVWRYRASETVGDVIVRRLPSLCGTDRWHANNGWRSLGAAEAHFFDARFGNVGCRRITQLELESN